MFCLMETEKGKSEEENFCNPLVDSYVCFRYGRSASVSDNQKRWRKYGTNSKTSVGESKLRSEQI